MRPESSTSVARILERIEIIRSGLRWTSSLDRAGIEKIIRQVNKLREEILLSTGVERYKRHYAEKSEQDTPPTERRQALLDRSFVFEGVFGDNPKLIETLETVEKAARTTLPILIQGESGTGKELLARVIHANSPRSEHPFLSVNCGAIVPTLLESELFGHTRGAFTGAIKERKGKFEVAEEGTIFLDEIGELSPENQVKLLRVLQNGEIQRVGSDEVIRVNPRVVAATNRDLYDMMIKETFREDLFYRLSVISVTLPPLRERRDEIPLFIDYFSTEAKEKVNKSHLKLSQRLRNFLLNYSYRGNIRELQNIIYRLACLSGNMADLEHLPENIRPPSGLPQASEAKAEAEKQTLDQVRKDATDAAEKQFLESQLALVNGNVTVLAKQIKMNRSYLQTLMKKRGVKAKDFKKAKNASGGPPGAKL